jgi:hypothetical protein
MMKVNLPGLVAGADHCRFGGAAAHCGHPGGPHRNSACGNAVASQIQDPLELLSACSLCKWHTAAACRRLTEIMWFLCSSVWGPSGTITWASLGTRDEALQGWEKDAGFQTWRRVSWGIIAAHWFFIQDLQ